MAADPVTGSIIGLGLIKKLGLVSLGSKLLKGAYITSFVNAISGNPLGSLIDRIAGKTVTTKENLDLNRKLLNLKGNRAGAIPSQEGALRFLGDRSGRLDDAPDIEATNQSVLDNIAKNQSLALGTTVAPDLDTKESVVDSFTGLVGIIQQINNNIGAIGQAMLDSSVIEGKYRQELIDDLEEEIAEKGKTRSKTRFERSVFNFVTRQKKKIATKTGNLSKDLSRALLLSLGLELSDISFGGDDPPEKEKNIIEKDIESRVETFEETTKALEESGLDAGTAQIVAEETAPKDLKDESVLKNINPAFSSSIPGIDDNFEGNSLLFFLLNRDIQKQLDKKEGTIDDSVEKDESMTGSDELSSNIDVMGGDNTQIINPATNVAFTPLESMSGNVQIIDMTTAKEIIGDTGSNNPMTVLDSERANLNPERRSSPYEGFVRSV